jgi:CDP-diacylglycerol--serine O-phosphatidyltransferase
MNFIPNLLTGINLFLGFWAIILAFEGNVLTACWLIVVASICDGLDGKIARFIHRSSDIGLELDSLADVVSFGVAPGIVLYVAYFNQLELIGLLLSALPLIFGAIRLARFNLTANPGERKPFYEGLPIPMQANTVVTFILFNYAIWGTMQLEILLIPLIWFLCLLMISHLPYEKIPRFSIKEAVHHPLRLTVIVVIISLLAFKPALAFFPFMLFYLARGIIMGLIKLPVPVEAEEIDSELEIKP